MFEPRVVDGIIEYPWCDHCHRVLTEEDHGDEAGSDGTVHWCCHWHSPEGLEFLAGCEAHLAFEAERVKEDSLLRLKAIIDDAVTEALRERGLA